ncbi:MAG: glycerophosphodiester phosphodiesterase family protein [Verrucomicrobiales bacterium]|nr:glycerophosphodiester phosphodiesterase family protein [Verrucomicrobiales bacterium]
MNAHTRLSKAACILSICAAVSMPAAAAEKEPDVAAAASRVSWIVAHRGASLERPECTLAAIRRSIEVGATAVEIDVRTSRDGELFLLHDATLDRTTNGSGEASSLLLADLQKLDAGSWYDAIYEGERIPSLKEAAAACKGKVDLLLDLKEQGEEYDRKVVGVIREHGDPSQTIVGVRSVAQTQRFREWLPEAKQLALIPEVGDIEAFAKAGADAIRLWPKWLEDGDQPAGRVRATGKLLHLNGTTGSLDETLTLLRHRPDSLLSDDPGRLRASLELAQRIKLPASSKLEWTQTNLHEKSFLNREYEMMEIPEELIGLPRIAFDGGSGGNVILEFLQPTVIFAAFEYNDSGGWSFSNGASPKEQGWQKWGDRTYRGSSNPGTDGKAKYAGLWYREFKEGQALSGLPGWWVCLGISGLETARKMDGFQEGLTSDTPPVVHRFSHVEAAGKTRPLHTADFDSADSIAQWQERKRKQFVEEMLFPYAGTIAVSSGDQEEKADYSQQEFQVDLNGERLFRFFRLAPLENEEPAGKEKQAAIVCFMGHGKVSQILNEEESYQHACAAHFAREGYIVYAMENIGMEPGADTHHDLNRALRLEGRGWYSLLFAHQRILLDRVFSDPDVDVNRVGVAGVSTGGLLALSAAVMEPRISAASVQGIFGSMRVSFIQDRDRHCSCGAIPGLLPEFDLPELALLVTPRALHVSNGADDGFSPAEAERCLNLIEPIYRKAGGKKPFFTVPEGGHAFALEPATEFFRQHLK